MLEWIKVLAPVVVSWPVAALLIVLLFRPAIARMFDAFMKASGSKAEIGPLKIELGKLAEEGKDAVDRLRKTTELMAESRLLELEITSQMFGSVFTAEQQERMHQHIESLRALSVSEPTPNPSIERASTSGLRPLAAAAHVKR